MLDALKQFFSSIGHLVAKAIGKAARLVTDEQLQRAIGLVEEAAHKFTDNLLRRQWVAKLLMEEFHLPENLANWLIETALIQIKHAEDAGIEAGIEKGLEGAQTLKPSTEPT